ncbi:type I-C CRISPR-associated protein Cas8c/Csd1 [Paenibacillus sp. SI8]|uniref:helix-turn-helix domain-containing protein n=1 Tax=unclassified Paenibacillus TaxID=185978 RepID=UPI0034651B96
MTRDEKFGRLLAIANVLCERVFEKDKQEVTVKYMERYHRKPMEVFGKIHNELIQYTHKFGEHEWHLFNMFDEIISNIDFSEFNNEPLNEVYLHSFHSQQHTLHNIMGVEDAAELWGYSNPGTVKNMCAEGKVKATKIGKTWVIDRNQPNPKQPDSHE